MKPTKILLSLLLCVILGQKAFSQIPGGQTSIFVASAEAWNGQTFPAILKLPNDYGATTKKYPLLVFLHGTGEAGNINGSQLANIYNSSTAGGPAYFIAHNSFPDSFANPLTGQYSKFIILSPQAPGWSSSGNQLMFIINDMMTKYRIDSTQIYLTGLSAGGQGVLDYVAHIGTTPVYKSAAIVPMSMAESSSQASANIIVGDSTRAWGFGSDPSDSHGTATHEEMNYMNNVVPNFARWTNYAGGHCCWNTYYDPNYRETINGHSMNIYEWMLTQMRPTLTVDAGSNQTILPPATSTSLSGVANDPNGTIVSYVWTKISGTGGAIVNPTSSTTSVTGLVPGSYIFKLTVTDNNSVSRSDSTLVNVSGTTLPVNLVNYSVTVTGQHEVSISWITTQEYNNDHFTIERSADGINFTALTTVQATNNPNGSNYLYKDVAPLNGYSFYRLSQSDIDGKTILFNVKKAFLGTANAGSIKVFPNPVDRDLQLQMDNNVRGTLHISIINAQGSVVKSADCIKSADYLFYYTPVDQLNPGLYVAQVKGTNYSLSIPFVKQ